MRADINPLFDYLRSHRAQALQDVIAFIDSSAYAQILKDWQDFLYDPQANEEAVERQPPANAAVPIISLASRRIRRWYQRVIAEGNALTIQPQDSQMHALRIKCKKLRYLIEFFQSVYPPDKVSLLVNQLKKLQDNLGEFNDLSVQQAYLLELAGKLPLDQEQTRLAAARALVATGSLVNSLAVRQQEVRNHFAETFKGFASDENKDLVRELYGKIGKKEFDEAKRNIASRDPRL
jgi:CHAD domain-containing protein